MARSLPNKGLVEEVPAAITDDIYAWRTGKDGTVLMLQSPRLVLRQLVWLMPLAMRPRCLPCPAARR